MNRKLSWILGALLLATAAQAVAGEAELIAVLKSGASQEEKATACRLLARVATRQSVPALAALLGDEKLSHMARYALETIPDPAADAALREAMGQLKGRPLMGVVGSLGARRDPKAVEPMAKLLADADADVVQSAARALGNIGTVEAAQALQAALAGAQGAKLANVAEGLFRCAETLAKQGKAAESLAIYDRLRALTDASKPIRAGALRGAILGRQKEGVPMLVEALGSSDRLLAATALRAAMEMPGAEVTAALAAALPRLPAPKQVLVIETLGYRGDAAAAPALLNLAAKGNDAVRLAAVRNLTHLGHAPALPLLAELSLGEGDLAKEARACLGNFPGKDAQATITSMLGHKDAKVRQLAVEMIGQRGDTGAAASLLQAAADAEADVRVAAIRALRDHARKADLPAVAGLVAKARSAAESQAAEAALSALCSRLSEPASGNIVIVKAQYGKLPEGPLADVTKRVTEMVKSGARAVEASNGNFGDPANGIQKQLRVDYMVNGVTISKTVAEQESLAFTSAAAPPAVIETIARVLDQSQGEAKAALVRSLRSAGGPAALQRVKAAMADQDPAVKNAALRAVCDWPTPDALPMVAELVKSPPSKTIKVLALRGFVRLVPQQDATGAQKIASLQEALAQADRDEEKRLVLSALGNVPAVEALALVASHLENPALKEEASLAAVTIAEKIVSGHKAEVAAAMQKVANATGNQKLAARAKALARQAKP